MLDSVGIETLCAEHLASLDDGQLNTVLRRMRWLDSARPDQIPPQDYFIWLLLAGRGAGKTRSGAEDMWWHGGTSPERIAVVGATNNDVRKTCFEGESGLLNVIPKEAIENYNRSSLEMWLKNGTYFVGYSSEEPERLRGPQHHRAWGDELCAWKRMRETFDMLMFGLRLGDKPQFVATSTPKPVKLLKEILAEEDTVVSHATTYDNAKHIPPSMLKKWREKYENTRLGRQELHAEILSAAEGALWSPEMINDARWAEDLPHMLRVVVAVDPATTADEETSNENGIVAAGLGVDGIGYVLRDDSAIMTPAEWAKAAVQVFDDVKADRIVAEGNQGGLMVEHTIRTVRQSIPVTIVHASRGKVARAEPVAALYEQGRVRHVGALAELEDQMTSWEPLSGNKSPDRLDALVWALTELMVDAPAAPAMLLTSRRR